MKTHIGMSLAAAIVALFGMTSIDCASAATRSSMGAEKPGVLTDASAARRAHRVYRHRRHRHDRPRVYVRGPYRPYYERPYYYVPQGPVPFFPFGFGYGLDPSW